MPEIPEEAVPPELAAILDRAAGREHSATGPVMTCLAEILAAHRRMLAERILLVAEIGNGLRCPRCHGQPASRRWPSGRIRSYRCGCGHTWDPNSAHQIRYQLSVQQILARLAAGEPMPPMPPKIEPTRGTTDQPNGAS